MNRAEAIAVLDAAYPVGRQGKTLLAERFNAAMPLDRRKSEDPGKFAALLQARAVLEFEARLECEGRGEGPPWAFDDDGNSVRDSTQAKAAEAHWEALKAQHSKGRR